MEQEQLQEQEIYQQPEQSEFPEVNLAEREQQAKTYVKKAKTAVKIIKILVSVAGGLAGVLILYGILAVTVMKGTEGALVGFLVILGFVAAVFIALIAMFVYAKINLDKLKKLN